jgi:hypothetical protein
VSYEEWLVTLPAEITADPLWKLEVYRLALFAADLGWHDVTKLMGDRRTSVSQISSIALLAR